MRAAQAVNYVNAGTIEFLVDKDKNFYFLEMNTRLQVEHPVTEMVTGIDIVKEQIRIARGRCLRHNQEDIHPNGWAIECRINAEDPYNNFIPSTGRITHTLLPTGPGVRVDTGVYIGFEVSPYYDSLISKLIVWGDTRGEAILRMRRALEEYKILGVHSNIPFHQRLMDSHRFMGGQYDTRFVEERFSIEEAEEGKEVSPRYRRHPGDAGGTPADGTRRTCDPAQRARHQQLEMAEPVGEAEEITMKYVTTIEGREYLVDILDEHRVSVDGSIHQMDFMPVGDQQVYSLVVNGKSVDANVYPNDDTWQVLFQGNLLLGYRGG